MCPITQSSKDTNTAFTEWRDSLQTEIRMVEYSQYPPSTAPLRFAMKVTINGPTTLKTKTLGSPRDRHTSKRAAKASVSKIAVEHLISIGQLAADGSVIKKQKGAAAQSPSIGQSEQEAQVATSGEAPTFSERVPELTKILGFSPPTYKMTLTNPELPESAFYDCSASFQPISGLPDPLATVRSVFGKKRAKEDCAREVHAALERVKEKRLRDAGLLPKTSAS